MKITRKEIREIIRESLELLREEEYDCIKDYMRMGYSRSQAQSMCGGSSSSNYGSRSRQYGGRRSRRKPMSYVGLNDGTAASIEEILKREGNNLTDWESKFLNSILFQLRNKRVGLSEKQQKHVARLQGKYEKKDINPGDGELTDDEAELMQQLASDAVAEESLDESVLSGEDILDLIRDEMSDIMMR